MKEINELNLPKDLKYSQEHEWAKENNGVIRVGINDYAQDQLGDIVFVELPQVGDSFDQGAQFGTVESVKAVSELFMPIGGEIVAINDELAESPELVNSNCYDQGWMIDVKPSDPGQFEQLLATDAYLTMLKDK